MDYCLVTQLKGSVDNDNLPVFNTLLITLKSALENPGQYDLWFRLRCVGQIKITSKYGYQRIYADGTTRDNVTEETLQANGYIRGRLNNVAGNTLCIENVYEVKGFTFNKGFVRATFNGLDSAGQYGKLIGVDFNFSNNTNFENLPITDISDYKGLYCVIEDSGSMDYKCVGINHWDNFAANNPEFKVFQTRGLAVNLNAVGSIPTLQQVKRCFGSLDAISSPDFKWIQFGWAESITGSLETMIDNIRASKVAAGLAPEGVIEILCNSGYTKVTATYNGGLLVDALEKEQSGGANYVHFTENTITINQDSTGYVYPNNPESQGWV